MENEEKRTWEVPEMIDLNIDDGTTTGATKTGPSIDGITSAQS